MSTDHKITVLVVDDEPDIKDFLAELLEFHGIQVLKAADGMEAWQIVESSPEIDLVVSDIAMPKMNGLELLKKIKADKPQLPVILITAYSNMMIPKVNRNGAQPEGFLNKPFDIYNLIKKIEELLPNGHLKKQSV